MTPPANEALAVIAGAVHCQCAGPDHNERVAKAHATLTRLLAAADGLAEQINDALDWIPSCDERGDLLRALTAYQEARRGR